MFEKQHPELSLCLGLTHFWGG